MHKIEVKAGGKAGMPPEQDTGLTGRRVTIICEARLALNGMQTPGVNFGLRERIGSGVRLATRDV